MRDYLQVPFDDPRLDSREGRYLAIDLELTGLDPRTAEILSAGYIPIDGPDIVHAGAEHILIVPEGEVGQSASIHGLTDDHLATGLPLAEVMPTVLHALAGRTLVAHHAQIEVGFLSRACERFYGQPLLVRSIDTLLLQRRVLRIGSDDEVRPGALRLQASRDRFNLPRYRAHEALTDAISAGELFLAQAAHLGGGSGMNIKALSG
ncbi:MAG: exonuclease domain-containing protein [Dermatophilaceae bacterium]|nr:3'-5' exonuclease [Intrasporangiaceae bacterium]